MPTVVPPMAPNGPPTINPVAPKISKLSNHDPEATSMAKSYNVILLTLYYLQFFKTKVIVYSTLISFPLGLVSFFLVNITSRIPLLYVDLTVSTSVSVSSSITL